jgi:hypothetical protein
MLKDEPYPEDGLLTVPLLKHQVLLENWWAGFQDVVI